MLIMGMLIGLVVGIALVVPLGWFELKRQTARARQAERRAQRAEQLAETGAMTGGLAHEIKNPLSTIGLNAQLLGEAIDDLTLPENEKSRLKKRVDTLRREAERLRDTLQDFLTYAGQVSLERRPVDLNQTVEEICDFYLPQAEHHGVRLRTQLAPEPLVAMIDPDVVKQALLNLLLNATQAMESSDRPRELILRTERIATRPRHEETDTARVHVIDTGPGIAPDRIESIFKPYFTTKAGGSGLGLPTTRRLVEAHGGTVEVQTSPGRGTDFIISLPLGAPA